MPHLDFGHVFGSSSDPVPAVVDVAEPSSRLENAGARSQRRTLATRLPRLHGSDRTTILFAILIFVGGLFCAFYFFNGVENLRAAAAWSREFLYQRPPALTATNDKVDLPPERKADAPAAVRNSRNPEGSRNNTSPFGRNLGSLYPSPSGNVSSGSATASLPGVTLASNPSSLLNQLNLPPSGGGTLAQTFDRAVGEIARVSTLYANAPLQIVKAPVSRVSQKMNAQIKNAEVKSRRDAAAQANALQKNVQNAPPQLARSFDRNSLDTPTTIISGSNLQRSLGAAGGGSGVGGGIGGLGGQGGPGGGAGAMSGGLGGAISGAVGGLGGIGK